MSHGSWVLWWCRVRAFGYLEALHIGNKGMADMTYILMFGMTCLLVSE